jgi:hypothetical protein
MAGIWTSAEGMDVNPKAEGPEHQPFIEHYELQPIDAQTNGPQLFYGLRYHTRIVKPNDPETFHDQLGHWLWEPATGTIMLTLSIPRGQAAVATGQAIPDAKSFTLVAVRGSLTNGILSNPFLGCGSAAASFFLRIRRSIPVAVPPGAGNHVNVRVRAQVLRVGIADLEHSGRPAGFVDQMMPIGIATPERGALPGAQCLFASIGNQCQLAIQNPDELVLMAMPVTLTGPGTWLDDGQVDAE